MNSRERRVQYATRNHTSSCNRLESVENRSDVIYACTKRYIVYSVVLCVVWWYVNDFFHIILLLFL